MFNYKKVKVNPEQLEYVCKMQNLLCERLGMELPKEKKKPEHIVEQALFILIDTMEKYYRLDELAWREFAQIWRGVTKATREFDEFKEETSGSYELLVKQYNKK